LAEGWSHQAGGRQRRSSNALDVTLDERLAKAPKADRRKLGFDDR